MDSIGAIQKGLHWNKNRFKYQNLLKKDCIMQPCFLTDLGALFSGDCIQVLKNIKDETSDTVFADPPFNLGKTYGKNTNDMLSEEKYVEWSKTWLLECIRVLKPGGSLFLYNLPKWNIILGAFLMQQGLMFRHWIAIEISACLPIQGKLHPSHYSLLYFSKNKPKTFRKIRIPIGVCRHCGKEIKDYGGHRSAMNPNGVNLKDVWTDIPPVRHWKFKSKKRTANALSTKLLNRIIGMSTQPGDLVLDPFGGSGTTYSVCESKGLHWLGIEIDFCPEIIDRLENHSILPHSTRDFIED